MQRFGKWTAFENAGSKTRCVCDCGIEGWIRNTALKAGNSKQCRPCSVRQAAQEANRVNVTHGMSKSIEWKRWRGMRRRCYDQKQPDYKLYGGRGIAVCDEWRLSGDGFINFYRDMGPIPSQNHEINRINNDGPYSKENCAWTSKKIQSRNRRSTHVVDVDGNSMSLADAAELRGLSYAMVLMRINKYGWTVERALTEAPKRRQPC